MKVIALLFICEAADRFQREGRRLRLSEILARHLYTQEDGLDKRDRLSMVQCPAAQAVRRRKTREGSNNPDRNAQFEHVNATVQAAIAAGEPAISVDTKKKELVGDFKNNGRELRPKGDPESVRVHDFKLPELGKVAPYGVYDIAANHGWVSVGIDADRCLRRGEHPPLVAEAGQPAPPRCHAVGHHG